jgi:uncharacterized repeat protein (TIGR01451 family)
MVGENVDFVVTVFNQGTIPATNITVTDYIPGQLQLNDPAWTPLSGNRASIAVAGPLAPGASIELPIRLRLAQAFGGAVVNSAEISSAADENGDPIRDLDSDPDAVPENDGAPLDDAIDNQNQDEDDADFAGVGVAVGIPSLNLFGLLALIIVLLTFGARRLTRFHR